MFKWRISIFGKIEETTRQQAIRVLFYLALDDGMVDLPNDDQPNNEAALYLLGSASIIASIVLAVVWILTQWWA